MSDADSTPWRRSHFARPYLASAAPEIAGPRHIRLRHDERILELTVEGDIDGACAVLTQLTDPASEVWIAMDATDPTGQLVAQLDQAGWILEAHEVGRDRAAQEVARLRTVADAAAEWNAEARALVGRGFDRRSLAAQALARCRRRWRRGSSLSAQIVDDLLDEKGIRPQRWNRGALAWTDVVEVERQVWTAVQLVAFAAVSGPPRAPEFVPRAVADGPGINLLVRAEHCAEALLDALGPTRFEGLLESKDKATRAAPVVFQHRWFHTLRYVDAVGALMHHRLGAELRELVGRYMAEEVGHEAHEIDSCRSAGVSDHEREQFAPLAWFAAHPDVLADLADRSPVSFLVSVTVAEGFPLGAKRVTERLAGGSLSSATMVRHDELDRELAHEGVTRTLLGAVRWVDASLARRTIADFLHVVELTHAGWNQLADYVDEGLPLSPKAFAISPALAVRIGASGA